MADFTLQPAGQHRWRVLVDGNIVGLVRRSRAGQSYYDITGVLDRPATRLCDAATPVFPSPEIAARAVALHARRRVA